jgi:hypothetical protein
VMRCRAHGEGMHSAPKGRGEGMERVARSQRACMQSCSAAEVRCTRAPRQWAVREGEHSSQDQPPTRQNLSRRSGCAPMRPLRRCSA